MNKKLRYLIIVLFAVFILLFIFFIIDYFLVLDKRDPLFCLRTKEYWDGGSYECYGPFYKINRYSNIDGSISRIDIGFWNMEFDSSFRD